MTKMNEKTLLIDAGNSRLKWASLVQSGLSAQTALAYGNKSPIAYYQDLVKKLKNDHQKIVLVSVLGDKFIEQAAEIAHDADLAFYSVNAKKQLGQLKNAYKRPEQLGADRFVALFAVCYSNVNDLEENDARCSGQHSIVIDCGTAVTIDVLAAGGQHLGGLILPGQHLCIGSLLKGTRQLELSASSSSEKTPALLGKDTDQAILAGSYYGLAGAIQYACSAIEKDIQSSQGTDKVNKIICGGGATALLPQLPGDFQSEPELIMQGLKLISEKYL